MWLRQHMMCCLMQELCSVDAYCQVCVCKQEPDLLCLGCGWSCSVTKRANKWLHKCLVEYALVTLNLFCICSSRSKLNRNAVKEVLVLIGSSPKSTIQGQVLARIVPWSSGGYFGQEKKWICFCIGTSVWQLWMWTRILLATFWSCCSISW